MQVPFDSPDSLLAGFLSPDRSGRLVLVTGPRGAGKTRWCTELVDSASRQGIHVGGVLSPAVFQEGVKVGIDLLDLHSRVRRRLAMRKSQQIGLHITENWHLDELTLSWANSRLLYSWHSRLLVLDELGLLELQRGIGLTNGLKLVASRRYQLAVVTMRPELLDLSLELWPWAEVFDLQLARQMEVAA